MTNLDKFKEEIKDMTPEQCSIYFHEYLCMKKIPEEHCNKYRMKECKKCKIDWLKSEAE